MEPHSVVIQYINALGFPVAASVALGLALWKIGVLLAGAFVTHLAENTAEMIKQTRTLERVEVELRTVCKADCANFQPRRRP